MFIEFINHSSIVVKSGDVSLMCDFWKEGMAFDNGWSLLCDTVFEYEDFSRITHLWFSHEHPDHFSPDNTKKIPEQYRKNITLLFQETVDKRLISFCRKLGFKEIIELKPGLKYELAPGFEVYCEAFGSPWGEVDSWLYVKTPDGTLLNANDCEFHDEKSAMDVAEKCQKWGGGIDVLAVQFSYASKQGNDSDTLWHARAQKECLDILDLKLRCFNPKYTLPFASYVYFCHEENRYLNGGILRVKDILSHIERYSEPLIMFPGDTWDNSQVSVDNQASLNRYEECYDSLSDIASDKFVSANEVVSVEDLLKAADKFLSKMLKSASSKQIGQYLALKHSVIRIHDGAGNPLVKVLKHFLNTLFARYEKGRIFVVDQKKSYELSLNGLKPADWAEDECQIKIGSQALRNCFAVSWGGETLQVNGRFYDVNEQWDFLSQYFFLARRIEQGLQLPQNIPLDYIAQKFRRA